MTELNIAIAGLMAICFLFGSVFGVAISFFVYVIGETRNKSVDRYHWKPESQVRREPPLPKKPKR